MTFAEDIVARARRTDPETSHAAAESVHDVRQSQRCVWLVLTYYGPMTDEALVARYMRSAYPNGKLPQQSVSGIRTRRSELVRRGMVEDTGERAALVSGRRAIVWAAVPGVLP